MPEPVTEPLHPYVQFAFDADPILASSSGHYENWSALGDIGPDAVAEQQRVRRHMLAVAERSPQATAGTTEWLDRQVLLTELRTAVRRDEEVRVLQRAPYFYVERLGEALSVPMGSVSMGSVPASAAPGDPAAGEALLGRLRGVPQYLEQAAANLTDDTPQLWAEMGVAAGRGLGDFLAVAVPGYAGALPAKLAADIGAAADGAATAVAGFVEFVSGLAARACGTWVAGREHVDFLLHTFHHLGLNAAELAEHGRQLAAADEVALVDFAATLDRDTPWQRQIGRIKDWHPEPEHYLDSYGAAMRNVVAHTRASNLVGLPDGEVCVMDWVPEYQREGLPLGMMATTPPYAPGLRSEFLITPGDPAASPDRRLQHMRDNCYVFAASIAGHETYPGHHLQQVHHKLGTPRSSIRRYFTSPQFVEGWGLYVEDLLEETGFMTDDQVRLFKRRNALWRALRIVIDAGLHCGTLSVQQAVEMLQLRAGMDHHMAAGEVRRYTRHDNPTYPSSYAIGRDELHRVRDSWQQRAGSGYSHREFHDALLSFGSAPVALVGRMLADITPTGSARVGAVLASEAPTARPE